MSRADISCANGCSFSNKDGLQLFPPWRWPIESAVVVDSGRYLSTVTCLGFYTWPHPSCQVTPAFRGSKLTFRMTSQSRLVVIATSLLQELKSLRLAGREWGRSSITLRSECVSPFSHNKIKICVANEQRKYCVLSTGQQREINSPLTSSCLLSADTMILCSGDAIRVISKLTMHHSSFKTW